MNITLRSAEGNLELELHYPKEFTGEGQLKERIMTRQATWGSLRIKDLWFEGACLFRSELNVQQDCKLHLKCDHFCWLMNFMTEGKLTSQVQDLPHALDLSTGQYHSFYSPQLNASVAVNRPLQMLTICLTHRFVKKYLWKYTSDQTAHLQHHDRSTVVLGAEVISEKVKGIVNEIFQAEAPDPISRIYLESKILELLFIQLEGNAARERSASATPELTPQDIEKLTAARTLIGLDLRNPYSLAELSRRTRLNDFKLKKGFKQLFGNTVFGYLNQLRMEKATQMLQAGNCAISDVAYAVGYKNAHHFTAAFKKATGLLPSEVKRGCGKGCVG